MAEIGLSSIKSDANGFQYWLERCGFSDLGLTTSTTVLGELDGRGGGGDKLGLTSVLSRDGGDATNRESGDEDDEDVVHNDDDDGSEGDKPVKKMEALRLARIAKRQARVERKAAKAAASISRREEKEANRRVAREAEGARVKRQYRRRKIDPHAPVDYVSEDKHIPGSLSQDDGGSATEVEELGEEDTKPDVDELGGLVEDRRCPTSPTPTADDDNMLMDIVREVVMAVRRKRGRPRKYSTVGVSVGEILVGVGFVQLCGGVEGVVDGCTEEEMET